MARSSFEEVKDVLAPPAAEVGSNFLKLGNKYVKTLFAFTYPRFLSSSWFTAIINLPNLLDISIFIHPVDTAIALRNLRKKAAQVQAQISEQEEKGMVRDPVLETAFQDIETVRDALQQAREKLYNAGLYITVYGDTPEEVKKLEEEISTNLEGKLVYAKPAIFQQLESFASVLPLGLDKLSINSPLNSGPISSFFPFVSADLTSDKGILYGINAHNNSLVIFDRFSLENANVVIFAKSGAGKSYAAKLEIIRSLMFGVDVLVIDPENEYKMLAESMAGSFFKISLASEKPVNPLESPGIPQDEDPAEVLRSHIVNLIGLLKLMLGTVTNEEDAILDRAITETYASREIVPGKDFSKAQPPLLEEELRPIAVYIILNFIWNLIRAKLKRRIMIIDEAWVMMKHPDSAAFLFGLVKRARKYYLGVTTITQEVEDFLHSEYGRPIITNSSLQILLKQAPGPSGIDIVAKTFDLTDAEKSLLLEAGPKANVSGLFFAGLKHIAIKIVPSYFEHRIITTNPEELLEIRKQKQ